MVNTASNQFVFASADFERIFPFFVQFDAADTVVAAGPSMRKLSPAVRPGARFSAVFEPKRPEAPFVFAQLVAEGARLRTIRETARGTLLRGQMQPLGSTLLFVGSPWISDPNDLRALELNLNDFAAHDPTLELLQLVQIQKIVADDLQRLTARLTAQAGELEAASRMKDVFLASMSHELRTPLTGILGLSEALLGQDCGPLNDAQSRYLRLVHGSGTQLLALVNDLLDLAKLGSGQQVIEREAAAVREICGLALQRVAAAAAQRGQPVRFENAVPEAVLPLDSRRLVQVLGHLLDNASKFTAPGGELGLRVRRDGRELRLTVWDRGIGIAADDLPRLFRPFTQIDGRLARRYEGMGLGLALTDRIVALHGGRVEVTSELGAGSEFTVVLPWDDAPTSP